MAEFWDLIVRSNTFNFIIMLVIFAIIWQKLDISTKIENMRIEIANIIEKSKQEKEKAEKHLTSTKAEIANLDEEIKETLEKAELSAQNVFNEIKQMATRSIEKIKEPTKIRHKICETTDVIALALLESVVRSVYFSSV